MTRNRSRSSRTAAGEQAGVAVQSFRTIWLNRWAPLIVPAKVFREIIHKLWDLAKKDRRGRRGEGGEWRSSGSCSSFSATGRRVAGVSAEFWLQVWFLTLVFTLRFSSISLFLPSAFTEPKSWRSEPPQHGSGTSENASYQCILRHFSWNLSHYLLFKNFWWAAST